MQKRVGENTQCEKLLRRKRREFKEFVENMTKDLGVHAARGAGASGVDIPQNVCTEMKKCRSRGRVRNGEMAVDHHRKRERKWLPRNTAPANK